jgi:hypothetical protein
LLQRAGLAQAMPILLLLLQRNACSDSMHQHAWWKYHTNQLETAVQFDRRMHHTESTFD